MARSELVELVFSGGKHCALWAPSRHCGVESLDNTSPRQNGSVGRLVVEFPDSVCDREIRQVAHEINRIGELGVMQLVNHSVVQFAYGWHHVSHSREGFSRRFRETWSVAEFGINHGGSKTAVRRD